VYVRANSYFAIGYGHNMFNTDMVFWGANNTDSQQLDLFSTGHYEPSIDPINVYNTTYIVNADGSVNFTSIRLLNPGVASNESFIMELDTPMPMIASYNSESSLMQWHGYANYDYWHLYVSSTNETKDFTTNSK